MKVLRKRNVRMDVVALLCLGCVVLGVLLRSLSGGTDTVSASSAAAVDVKYVCPMNISYHPYFSSEDPKEKCGYCGMDLVADAGHDSDEGERVLVMSEAAMKLAEVEVMPVERRFVDIEIPMSGKIDFDDDELAALRQFQRGLGI